MRELTLKSKIIQLSDYKSFDILENLPKFSLDINKFDQDMKRCQYKNGIKNEVDIIGENDLVRLSCTSDNQRFNKKDIYVVVGKNLWDKEFEEKLIGCEKNKTIELEVDQTKVSVNISSIIRTSVPELNDENVKKWGIEGITSVEELKKHFVSRQVINFCNQEEPAEMLLTQMVMEFIKNSEFELVEEEILAMRKTVDYQINQAKLMREQMIKNGDIDPNEPWDVLSMVEDMVFNTLKSAIVGQKFLQEDGYSIHEEDYENAIKNRSIQLNISEEEAKNQYAEKEFVIETCSCYFFDKLEEYQRGILKDAYYEQNKKRLDVFDVAIIGAGPAGLSAALTLNVHNKNIVWFGNDALSDKIQKSEKIVNYAGFDSITGNELNNHFRNQIQKAKLELTNKMVTQITKTKNGFMVLGDNDVYKAKTVLLTIGAVAPKGIENEHELLGQGVSYCATCDGFLYEEKEIAVFCGNSRYEHEVEYLAEIASKVYCYCAYSNSNIQSKNVVMLEKPMKKVIGEQKVEGIVLTDGTTISVDGAFFLRDSVAPSTMLKDLELDGAHIATKRNMETNIPGCYAAGDITGRPYQIAKAVGEGNIAAHTIIEYLSKK